MEGKDYFFDPVIRQNRPCSSICPALPACNHFCPKFEVTSAAPVADTQTTTTNWLILVFVPLGAFGLLILVLIILHKKFDIHLPCFQTKNTCAQCSENKPVQETGNHTINQSTLANRTMAPRSQDRNPYQGVCPDAVNLQRPEGQNGQPLERPSELRYVGSDQGSAKNAAARKPDHTVNIQIALYDEDARQIEPLLA